MSNNKNFEFDLETYTFPINTWISNINIMDNPCRPTVLDESERFFKNLCKNWYKNNTLRVEDVLKDNKDCFQMIDDPIQEIYIDFFMKVREKKLKDHMNSASEFPY